MSKRLKSVSLLLSLMCASPMGMYANSLSGEADVSMSQQKSSFSGTVKDATGEPIIGASVFIKNTTVGTVTDLDGNFQLQDLNKGDVIVVSFIGYLTQEIKYAGQNKLVVTLKEDKKTLDEVVVVGFGTQKKVNLTGAVGTVDSEALESRPVTNATQALQGLVPGLQISQNGGGLDNGAKIQVRGTATIGEGSTGSPLILIDGMEGDLNSINPQDIENISVLKDAAASSIYGSRAPFGVILVTTKAGKEGKAKVNYNNSLRWSAPVKMPEQMDSYTFATYFNDANKNIGSGPHFNAEHLQRIKDYQTGKITSPIPTNGNYWADGYAAGNANTDWYDALYRDWTFSHEHNLSVNGGNGKVRYYFSGNFMNQNGLMEFNQDKYNRYTTTAKVQVNLAKWIKMNYSNRFTRQDFERPSRMDRWLYYNLARQGWPTLPLYDENGYLYSSPSPALGIRDGGRNKVQTDNLYQQISFIIEPIKNWVTHVDANYRIRSINKHQDKKATYNHDIHGNPIMYDQDSEVHESSIRDNYLNFNAYSEYSHKLESGHNFKAMLGFQAETMRYGSFGLTNSGLIIPDLPEVDITTGLDATGKPVTPSVNGKHQRWNTAGFFGRLNYNYKERYMAEVNLRYDGTSRFRKDQRWNWFPSFSLGWNIAREGFWEDWVNKVNVLKLRASYGELGNQNTSAWYPTYQTMNVVANGSDWIQNGARPNAAYVPGLISSTLGWERVRNWNIGLDFGAFNNRLTGSFDFYQRKTLDMIGPAPELPAILGLEVPKTNNTDLKTYGFDLNISWNDRLKNGLGYGVSFILSDSQTKITKYPNPTESLGQFISGHKMGEIWGYETIGIAKSKEEMNNHLASLPNGGQSALGSQWDAGDIMYKDLNGDGKIDNGSNSLHNHGDLKVIGNNTPRFQFGLDLSADWKGVDVRAFFQGVMKRDVWQDSPYFWGATRHGIWHSTGFKQHADYFRAEPSNDLPANLDAYYPRPTFGKTKNAQRQTRYLQDASYIRLKNVQIGYTLPSELTQKLSISKMRFFISGENLWTGTSLSDIFDPETVDGGDGGNGNAYPLFKTVSVGLSLTL